MVSSAWGAHPTPKRAHVCRAKHAAVHARPSLVNPQRTTVWMPATFALGTNANLFHLMESALFPLMRPKPSCALLGKSAKSLIPVDRAMMAFAKQVLQTFVVHPPPARLVRFVAPTPLWGSLTSATRGQTSARFALLIPLSQSPTKSTAEVQQFALLPASAMRENATWMHATARAAGELSALQAFARTKLRAKSYLPGAVSRPRKLPLLAARRLSTVCVLSTTLAATL